MTVTDTIKHTAIGVLAVCIAMVLQLAVGWYLVYLDCKDAVRAWRGKDT